MQELCLAPEEVMQVVTQIKETAPEIDQSRNRRIESRDMVVVALAVQPVSASFDRVGEPLPGTCRNLSMGGIGFSTTTSFDEPLALVYFEPGQISETPPLLVKIRHRRFVGPLFEIGGQFYVEWNMDA